MPEVDPETSYYPNKATVLAMFAEWDRLGEEEEEYERGLRAEPPTCRRRGFMGLETADAVTETPPAYVVAVTPAPAVVTAVADTPAAVADAPAAVADAPAAETVAAESKVAAETDKATAAASQDAYEEDIACALLVGVVIGVLGTVGAAALARLWTH